jgi:hypothetical protein
MKEVKEVEESSGERLVARGKIFYRRGAESVERRGRQRRGNRREILRFRMTVFFGLWRQNAMRRKPGRSKVRPLHNSAGGAERGAGMKASATNLIPGKRKPLG